MSANNNISFRLKSIEEMLYNISLIEQTHLDKDNLRVQFMTQTFLDIKNNLIKIKVGTKYNAQEVSILNLELLFTFSIDNINNLVSVDKKDMRLHFKADLIPTFINIAIGGMRGVLYEKVKSTKLKEFPLPLVDLQEVLKNNSFHVEE